MIEEEPITLKYGDQIILRCTTENKANYLIFKGEQYWMESYLQTTNQRTFNMYYFQQHMILTIFPKLLYEAQKKYNSDKSQMGANSDIQRQLLQSRMETEKKYNQLQIRNIYGTPVKYGDTIMLYSELSQLFLQKGENNANSNNSSILSSQMYYVIQPDPLALDLKYGSVVRSFDQFLLIQNDSILKLDNLDPILKLPEIQKSKNFDHNNQYLTIPSIMENQNQFQFYKAVYKQCLNETKERLSHNALQAIVIPKAGDSTHLHYGQFVRIKHYKQIFKDQKEKKNRSIKQDEKQEFLINQGYLTSSINAVGCYPSVYLQINDIQNMDVLEKISSIFQVVPEVDNKFGQQVNFQVDNKPNLVGHTHFLLRHLLTGQFLSVSKSTMQLELSSKLLDNYKQITQNHIKQEVKSITDSIKVSSKNQPAIKLYQNYLNTQQNEERLLTQPQQPQQQAPEDLYPNQIFQQESFIFITKLGNNPTFNKETLPFTLETNFTMATYDGIKPIEVDLQEAYVEKLMTRQGNFNYYQEESNPEITLKKQLHDEWLLLLPDLDQFHKRTKASLSVQERAVLEFIDKEEKAQAYQKKTMGHFKQSNDTYLSTFINLNPLKTRYYDVSASEDFSGSNFQFEIVDSEEIENYNELITWMYPLIDFAKHPIQLSSIKLKLSNLRFKDQNDLSYKFQMIQNQTIQNIGLCVRSIIKIMLWISDTHEALAMGNQISEPIVSRQTLLREIGCIDFVIKILYELHINGLLYESQDQIAQDEEIYEQEINSLIGAISSFLQLVCKNSYENSLYTVQWYFLYKIILLKGQLNDLMRLDILITQLFQQTDMNVTFQFEVETLSKETKYSNYNQHAYNLLIAFCLHTKYRQKEGVEEIIQLIFVQNRDTIFAQLHYDEQMYNTIRNPLQKMQSIDSAGNQFSSPSLIQRNAFSTKAQKHDYLITCLRLASELAKSSPSLTLKYIKQIFPFEVCASVVQDTLIQATTRYNFLELIQNSYLAKHLLPLPRIEFPQQIKIITRSELKGFLGLFKREQCQIKYYIFSQKKIADMLQKVRNKYLSGNENCLDFWIFMSQFLSTFWKNKTIYEIKSADHIYIKQLLLTFTMLFNKGLFIEYLEEAYNFYNMYHRFIEFLKTSLVSATLEEQFLKHQLHGKKQQSESKPQEVRDYLFEKTVSQKKKNKAPYAKSMIWLDELIDILILLEKYQQSRIVDQFIQTEDNFTVFDDLKYLQKFATQSRYKDVVQKLKQAKRSSYNVRAKIQRLDSKDVFTTQELTKILRECSFSRKTLILEYMSGLKQSDISLIYFLTELLTFNQIRLSASVTELIWTIYSTRSNFLQTLNKTMLLDEDDENDNQQPTLQSSISTEFSNIYWKLHFAIVSLHKSLEQDSQKNYEQINDALSDILVIVYPDYAAKSDMQMFLEINQLENEERHNQAQEQKMVKSKVRQEMQQDQSKLEFDMIDQSAYSPVRRGEEHQSNKSQTNIDSSSKLVWRINNQLSIDVISIYQRQKLLRYLGFHTLLQKMIEDLIIKAKGNLFREKDVQLSQTKHKGWEIKSEILEKAVLFLIYFVIRNEENQELILNSSLNKDSYLHEMTSVKRKQLQTLIYILFAELFRDNYLILFYLDKYSYQDSLVNLMFQRFGTNFQAKNYEAGIYFLQFIAVLLRVKDSDVVQNNELIITLFSQSKNLVTFNKEIQNLISSFYTKRIEQFKQGVPAHLETPQNRRRHLDNSYIEMPVEMLFIQEYIRLLTTLCSKRSPVINEFIKNILPLSLIQEMLTHLDEWYTLKYELIQYFRMVYLQNINLLSYDEKQEVLLTITEFIFKQLQQSYLDNQQIRKFYQMKFQNNTIFNIYGLHNYYSTQDLVLSVEFEKAVHIYIIYGILEICKEYVKQVMPRFFFNSLEQENFDDKAKNDLLFLAPALCDTLNRIKESFQEGPAHHQMLASMRKKSARKQNKTLLLTQKLLSSNQEEDKQDIQDQIPQEENEEDKQYVTKVHEISRFIQQSDYGFTLMKNDMVQLEKGILIKWENAIISNKKKLIDEHLIISEREQEIQQLVNLIITLKRDNTNKFKQMVTALIQILSEDSVSSTVKLKSINILRKLSNYKEDSRVSKSILKDLSELGFTDFLCDLIKQEYNSEQKLEYIKAFVDYIDDSSFEIQSSFFYYLQGDLNNTFILSLQQFVKDMFQDIRMAEISNLERKNPSIAIIINNKINACIYVFELFRLACEDHFEQVQEFLRVQPNSKQPINFITFAAELFEKYVEIMNENNAPLGQKLLDFLIECVQGPCLSNQNELCHNTKLLEILEQIILEQRIDQKQFQRRDIFYSNLRAKVFLLQLSLMEGNSDQIIAKKISQYFNPQILFERIELVYWKIIKKIRNTQIQINLEVKVLNRIKTEADESGNNHGVIQTKDTRETLPNQNIFMEYFQDQQATKVLDMDKFSQIPIHINSISEEDMENMVNESFTMYLLLKKLSSQIPEIKSFTEDGSTKLKKALTYYKLQTASIEIVNMNGNLEKIYFQLPTLMHYLTQETKLKFLEIVCRDSINDKINGLLDNTDNFYMEMVHFMKLRKIGLRYNNKFIVYLRNICMLIAFMINLLITINDSEDGITTAVNTLAIINLILYSIILVVWITIRMQLEYDKIYKTVSDFICLNYFKKTNQSANSNKEQILVYPFQITVLQNLLIIKALIFNSYTFYWFLLVFFCIMGLLYNRFFYGLLLLDIIDHSPVLRNVIKSISQNYKQLLMTALLGVLMMYLYSLIAYQSTGFRDQLQFDNSIESTDELDNKVCYSAFQCWVFLVHQGLRAGGGIGDVLKSPPMHSDIPFYSQRVLYDVSFFIIINIIWLNIIFGIIIDTFAELRDNKNLRDFDSQNRCFICNLSRTVFEKEGVSFDNHVEKYHNPWNYLAYIVYLRVKVKTEHTGIESYVNSKISKRDISWFPIQKALDLELLGVQLKEIEQE